MRKSYLCCLIILIFWVVGTSSGVERRVEGNVFYSSYPKMAVKISSDFHYIGKKKKEYVPNVLGGGTYSRNYTFEFYTWSCSKLILFIGFKEFQGMDLDWLPLIDIWQGYPNVQDKGGYCKLLNHTYAYCVYKNKKGALNKIYMRNTSDSKIQIVIGLVDRTHTADLKEFAKNCAEVFKD